MLSSRQEVTMLRTKTGLLALTLGAALLPATAQAQSQTVTFNLGYFGLTSEDARGTDDVLFSELNQAFGNADYSLLFEVGDFSGATVGADWHMGIGRYLEAGVGASFYRHTVHSIYKDFVDTDGSELEQDLRLRVAPLTATVRLFPFGRATNGVQPYVGGGVGAFFWRYTEIGEFIDPRDNRVFLADPPYEDEGTAAGPIVFGGVRFPLGPAFLLGGELRWHRAEGELSDDFIAPKIDLGGWTGSFTMALRF
jgi:hypothetical protein